MSEKRRRQQDRRAKRQAARRSRDAGDFADRELAQIMDRMVSTVLKDVSGLADPIEVECWASETVSIWSEEKVPYATGEEVFLPAFVRALERKASAKALAALRALGTVGSESLTRRAAAAADRLARRGLPEPRWLARVGRAQPVAAELMYEESLIPTRSTLSSSSTTRASPHNAPDRPQLRRMDRCRTSYRTV